MSMYNPTWLDWPYEDINDPYRDAINQQQKTYGFSDVYGTQYLQGLPELMAMTSMLQSGYNLATTKQPRKEKGNLLENIGGNLIGTRNPNEEGEYGGQAGGLIGSLIGSIWGPIGRMAGRHGGRLAGSHIGNLIGGADPWEEVLMQFMFDPIKDLINPLGALG